MSIAQELTVREAAQRTHRSEETIRRWIWSGRLPARKHGNSYRIDVIYLDQIAVAYDSAGDSHAAGSRESFGAWLDDLDRWKQGLPAASRVSAADLVIEDRHARR